MTFRPLDAVLAIVCIGAGIAAVATGRLSLAMMSDLDSEDGQAAPQNVVPEGHTISGNVNANRYIVAGPRATHAQCAMEICPRLKGSLGCK